MKHTRKLLSLLLALCLLTGLVSAAAVDAGEKRAIIGADLTSDQIDTVYGAFGMTRGDVQEITVTNADERQYLEGLVDESVIGTHAISCAYLEVLPQGEGITVKTSHITYCTSQMYISALATAGITDANVVIAAPFDVSGTAALTGIYKAYEDITGEKLDETAKEVSSQELAVTSDLAQEIGEADSVEIVNQLKLILDETRKMTDDELRQQIIDIAAEYDVTLTDEQISQLIDLCRAMEKLDPSQLLEKVQSVQRSLQQFAEAAQKASGFAESVKTFFQNAGETIKGFLDKVLSLFGK